MSAELVIGQKRISSHSVVPAQGSQSWHGPKLPRNAERWPASPTFGHDFGLVPVHAQPITAGICPMSLASPRACPFGGACHTCPTRVQAKLAVSRPGDVYEQEADRVAENITRMAETPLIQRKCVLCRNDEDDLQMKEAPGSSATSLLEPAAAGTVQAALYSSGQPLDAETRDFMESRFGEDFGQVRIHTDKPAADSARAMNALAYTMKSSIIFAVGEYSPRTMPGKRLLAHELAHVVQQGGPGSHSSQHSHPAIDGLADIGISNHSSLQSPMIQRVCGPAAIGVPAGCSVQASSFITGYPTFSFNNNCDDLAPGEEARLITAVTAMPASAMIEIHGFASTSGDAAFNVNLSCARALRARTILTSPAPAGAGLPPARIRGIFNHGPTPGPASRRRVVAITPPTPTPLPSTVPAAGPTDFQINQVGTSTTSRIFFGPGSAALALQDRIAIFLIKLSAPASVRLIGYASADEPAVLAQNRANAVRTALTSPPMPVTVASAVGNAGATAERSDFRQARSVEVLVGATPPSTVDCHARDPLGNLINPPKQPCPTMDPPTWTAFNAALPIAQDAMTRAVASVAGTPTTANAAVIDRFFGNHSASTLTALRTNLGRLRTHVNSLPGITTCGGQCDTGGCAEGPIAYHTQVGVPAAMTLCVPLFKNMHNNDRGRNLIHESAHGTAPLGGSWSRGTRDLAYRHERMLFQLSPPDRLRNSDSYALFALFLREVQMTGNPLAVPAGISTPAQDVLTGFGTDRPALELALARLEKRLTWAADHVGQLYGEVNSIRRGTLTWAGSSAESLMRQAAARFPLTAPPAAPSMTDQIRIAGILDRYTRMKRAVKQNLTVTRMPAGVISWPTTAGAWVAGTTLQIGPDFFRATPDHQVALLLEQLARGTRDVEPAFVPAYVTLADWIHRNP